MPVRTHFLMSAALGAAVWLAAVPLLPSSIHREIITVVLLGPLVIVPLGLVRIVTDNRSRHLPWVQFLAAVAFTAAFVSPEEDAAWFAVPWLGVTFWIATLRLERSSILRVPELCALAATVYLPVGAAWGLASRFGYRPVGFPDTIVLLTAAHFHFAGFAFPVLAGEIVRRSPSRLARVAALIAVAAVPLVATGITVTQLGGPREFELAAAWLLAGTGLLLGAYQLRLSVSARPLAGICLAVSALSLMVALAWTAVYAGGQYGIWPAISIPFMTRWHGMINAFGFALLGLIGWSIRRADP